MKPIPFQRPQLPAVEHVEHYFAQSRAAHWFSNEGPCARLLCARLADYVGGEAHCITVSSGTLGLAVALRAALATQPRAREVLVPSYTYIASVSAILWAGLEPVFVDVAVDHWHLDPSQLEIALADRDDRVAAVLACSTFGCAPPQEVRQAWELLCRQAEKPLIVDSAAGFGSRDESGRRLGHQGDLEVFSFHATKPFAIGEGGAAFTPDGELAERVKRQTRFGLDDDRRLADDPGLNAKMSELHAATALAALDNFAGVLAARASKAAAIREGLADCGLTFQLNCERSASQFVPALAPSARARRLVLESATRQSVQLRTYHEPLHMMGRLQSFVVVGDLQATLDLAGRSLSLPLANDLTDEEIDRVRRVVVDALSLD